MSLRSSIWRFSQWGELCFLRMGGGWVFGVGSCSICILLMVTCLVVGFRTVMYVTERCTVWYLFRSAITRGEDGIDRYGVVRLPCITPLQGIFTASRGSIVSSWFSIGASF